MTDIVVGNEKREGIGAGTVVFTIGMIIGVLLGSFIGGALTTCDPEPSHGRQARPGEICECWVRP